MVKIGEGTPGDFVSGNNDRNGDGELPIICYEVNPEESQGRVDADDRGEEGFGLLSGNFFSFHIHIPNFIARHHAKVTLNRMANEAKGEDFFEFLHPFYDLVHSKIAKCGECGRRYQEAYRKNAA